MGWDGSGCLWGWVGEVGWGAGGVGGVGGGRGMVGCGGMDRVGVGLEWGVVGG